MLEIKPPSAPNAAPPSAGEQPKLDPQKLERAKEFESIFIAQMLKFSGLEKAISGQSGFGGEAYSSLLLEQYANKIVESGGFGLAEHIYKQLR